MDWVDGQGHVFTHEICEAQSKQETGLCALCDPQAMAMIRLIEWVG